MNKRTWFQIAKWIWLIFVFIGVTYYIAKNYQSLIGQLHQFSIISLIASVIFLVIGKLFLTILTQMALEGQQQWKPAFWQIFYINAIIQLAKYLPGGVWHFVGRFGLYKVKGISAKRSGKIIIGENLWLVLSGFVFGMVLNFSYFHFILSGWVHFPERFVSFSIWVIVFLLVWVVGLFLIERFFLFRGKFKISRIIYIMIIQIFVWLFLGLGFFSIISIKWDWILTPVVIGIFCLSWVIGYLAVFAPSGLGVREVVIVALLSTYISPEKTVVLAAVYRLMWVLTEMGIGLISEIIFGSKNKDILQQLS